MARRWLALFVLGFATWVLLTWTLTLEQLVVGVVFAAVVATACAPLGPVARPWLVLAPARLFAIVRTAVWALGQIVRANVGLSRRIWAPSLPLRLGMVIVPSDMESEGEYTALGIISSLIVDNQLVDLDRRRRELQYHCVWVESDDPERNRQRTSGPVEDRLKAITRRPPS